VKNVVDKEQDLVKVNQVTMHNLKNELQKYHNYILIQSNSIFKIEDENHKKNIEVQKNGLKYTIVRNN